MRFIKFEITSISPLLMHSPKFADPLNPDTQAHKMLTGKRKKTDDDHMAIQRSEWMGSLYYNDEHGVHVPGEMFKASLIGGAKLQKLGAAFGRSVIVNDSKCSLKYKGPKDREALYEDGRFIDKRSVVVSQARLMRTRPIFENWEFEVLVLFNESMVNEEDIVKAAEDAGMFIGIGDYRPDKKGSFGRYEVKAVEVGVFN